MAGLTKKELRHDAVHEELEKITVTVVKKRNSILLGILILLVVCVAVYQIINNKNTKKANAENNLANAGTNTIALAEIPSKYPGTHGAKSALLRLAADATSSTNYTLARDYYTRVAKEYPNDEYADAAWLCVARCYMGEGEYDQAVNVLNEKLMKGPHAQNAKYLLFKIYVLQGKDDEALAVAKELEDLKDSPLLEDVTASIWRKNGNYPEEAAEEAGSEAESEK
ncbi:tetratricopeptide repeat protein [bacterium]|nr:tetratricopeptide repeat protein [bacterium]